MNKKLLEKEAYIAPWCKAVQAETEPYFLAGSPAVQPGGGGGGGIVVIPGDDDDDDTEISGAKQSQWGDLWED